MYKRTVYACIPKSKLPDELKWIVDSNHATNYVTVDEYKLIRACAIDDACHTDGTPMVYFSEVDPLGAVESQQRIYALLERTDGHRTALGISPHRRAQEG